MSIRTRLLAMVVPALVAAMAMPAPGRAAEKITLITTGKGSPLEWPLYIAMQRGFLAANGVEIDLLSANSTAAVMQQVTGGSGDIGVGGLTDPIHAIDRGAKLSILMLETSKPPYSLWGKPGIPAIGGLRGKMIIVGGSKDITRIYFERMAGPGGLKPGDYDLTYAGTTPARYAALLSGAVDAAILYPPASFKALDAGYSKLGEVSEAVGGLPFTGYAVNVAWAKSHGDAVRGFAKGVGQGVAWFYDPANRQEAIEILIKASNADRRDVERTYDYFRALHLYPDVTTLEPGMLGGLLAALSALGDLEGPADPARFIDKDVAKLVEAAR